MHHQIFDEYKQKIRAQESLEEKNIDGHGQVTLDLKEEINPFEVSLFINDDTSIEDKEIFMRQIENHPFKIVPNKHLHKFGA